jgi:hypothetical protein
VISRQVQRVEQGMGRGVRSSDDFCAVLLFGPRLMQRLNSPAARGRFSPATRAQFELSESLSAQLAEQSVDEILRAIQSFLARDAEWVKASREQLAGVVYDPPLGTDPTAVATRDAFDLASVGRHQEAAERLRGVIDSATDLKMRGWLKQRAASYLDAVDHVEAQKMQKSAVTDNRALTRPIAGITYERLSAAAVSQAAAASQFLSQQYSSGNELIIGSEALLEMLVFDPDATEQFEEGMLQLASHLGFKGQRPERDTGVGPDNLWALGGLSFWIIECKSGATGDEIWKKDAAQLGQAVDWFRTNYDSTCVCVPILVHPSNRLERRAAARAETRVLTREGLQAMKDAARGFFQAVSPMQSYADEAAVARQLTASGLTAGALLQFTREPRAAAR